MDEEYFKRMEAIEFTVQTDDGKSLVRLKEAEVILLGVSRTSKTPICVILPTKALRQQTTPLFMVLKWMRNCFGCREKNDRADDER